MIYQSTSLRGFFLQYHIITYILRVREQTKKCVILLLKMINCKFGQLQADIFFLWHNNQLIKMKLFGKSQILHHFKIFFPVPVDKIQNCLKRLQHLNHNNTSGVCISFNGHSQSPQTCQLLHESLLSLRDINRLSVFTFLEDKATSLTYFTASAGQTVSANPYSIIGDIGTTQKTYRNIKKLLDLIGIKYTQLGTKNESSQLWNQFVQQSEKQKEITKKWLNVVQQNMINSVINRRKISKQQAEVLKNKILHPQQALKAKLIDSIGTFEEFAELNYPNHTIEDIVYKLDGTRIHPNLTQRQLSAFETLFQVIQMPSVALATSQDLVLSSLHEIINLLQSRLMSQQSLDELQSFLEMLFNKVESYESHQGLVF